MGADNQESENMPENTFEKKVFVLGAATGGSHIIVTLHGHCPIAGVYDQNVEAPGLAKARKRGIQVYAGDWKHLKTMLVTRCRAEPDNEFYTFLPSRHADFIRFATRKFIEAQDDLKKNDIHNLKKLLRMGVDFGDYARAEQLCSLMNQ